MNNLTNKNLVVEFVGLPGSGKTTIYHKVYEDLKLEGLLHNTDGFNLHSGFKHKLYSLLSYGKYFIGNPILNFQALFNIVNSDQSSYYDLQIALKAWLGSSYLIDFYKKNTFGVNLIDQGVFQALWQIGFGSQEIDIARIYGQIFSNAPDLIILLEASIETISRRINNRESPGRLDNRISLSPHYLDKAFDLYQQIKSMLFEISRDNKIKSLVINNDSDGDVITKSKIVVDFIRAEWQYSMCGEICQS